MAATWNALEPFSEDLPPQIPLIHRLVDTFRIPKLLVKGVEGDDVVGFGEDVEGAVSGQGQAARVVEGRARRGAVAVDFRTVVPTRLQKSE